MFVRRIRSLALLGAVCFSAMPAEAALRPPERPPERVCLVISLDPGGFFPRTSLSDTKYAQWESTLAVQLAQHMERSLSEILEKRRSKRTIDVQQVSARADLTFPWSSCTGAPTVIRGRIEPVVGELRSKVTYEITSSRPTRMYQWVSSSPYRPGIHMPQDPFGGALDGVDEQAGELVRIVLEMIG